MVMGNRKAIKVAIVTPISPYPPDSGSRIRIYNIIRTMAQHGMKIFLLTFDSKHHGELPPDLETNVQDLRILSPNIEADRLSPLKRFLRKIFGGPFESRPGLTREIDIALQEWSPDFIHIEKTIGAAYLNISRFKSKGIRLVLDEGGVNHLTYERQAAVATHPVNKWIFKRRAKRLKLFEKTIIAQMDAVLAVSEKEENLLRSVNPKVNVLVTPNGVHERIFQEEVSPVAQREWAAFFCGSLSYFPNRDAVEIYLRYIMPCLSKKAIKLNFVVAGGDVPTGLIEEARKNPQFKLMGYVDSVEPFFKKFAIFVNPMRLGGGTRLKLLEAMAYGMSCVSTSIGAEGITIDNSKHAMIADTPEAFASSLEYLIRNPEQATELGNAARAMIRSRYPWPHCLNKLISFYETAT